MRVVGNKAVCTLQFIKKSITHADVRLRIPLKGFGCFKLCKRFVDDLKQLSTASLPKVLP